LRSAFSSAGATTIDRAADRDAPVMNEPRPAVQLACPYQFVKSAPSLAMRSTFGVGWPNPLHRARAAEVVPASVVGHEDHDVGLPAARVLRRRGRCSLRGGGQGLAFGIHQGLAGAACGSGRVLWLSGAAGQQNGADGSRGLEDLHHGFS
jgi:hypothetical protein